jgi:hypothetical protein
LDAKIRERLHNHLTERFPQAECRYRSAKDNSQHFLASRVQHY